MGEEGVRGNYLRMINRIKQKIHEISKMFEVEVLPIECDSNHLHVLSKAKLMNISKYNALKTITLRETGGNKHLNDHLVS